MSFSKDRVVFDSSVKTEINLRKKVKKLENKLKYFRRKVKKQEQKILSLQQSEKSCEHNIIEHFMSDNLEVNCPACRSTDEPVCMSGIELNSKAQYDAASTEYLVCPDCHYIYSYHY